jgi:hypothetical protein
MACSVIALYQDFFGSGSVAPLKMPLAVEALGKDDKQ